MKTLIVFDLDGVITSEAAYWDAAGLTLHELLYSPRYWNLDGRAAYEPVRGAEESRSLARATLPEAEILALKARAINSNWDTCYAAVCLRLIDLLARLREYAKLSSLLPLRPWEVDWLARFRHAVAGLPGSERILLCVAADEVHIFDTPAFQGATGLELINRFDVYASDVLGQRIEGVFSRLSPFWDFCREIFQEWYLGDSLYKQTYGRAPAQPGKPGCVYFEVPLLPVERVRETLAALKERGYTLGFATGRVRQEAVLPLRNYGLLDYFDEAHMSPYDYVEQAEAELRLRGDQTLLSKPHPFQFLFALTHDYEVSAVKGPATTQSFIIVGDSTSDIIGGRAAGALTVAVLTGARTDEARALLARSEPDFTISDILALPDLLEKIDSLATIQRLQFTEREKAGRLLRLWFARHMDLQVGEVTLTPKPTSLNSFNGLYRQDGEEFFFKTHVEEQGVLSEYYHAELLHNAGYNVVMPLRTLHEGGRQMVVYPRVRRPVMFDLVRAFETPDEHPQFPVISEGPSGPIAFQAIETSMIDTIRLADLFNAERHASHVLRKIYEATATWSAAEEHAAAPIHQLFWHRLAGGRLDSFYRGKLVSLPNGGAIPFDELLGYRWRINGVEQPLTLGGLIARALRVLDPAQPALTIIGHGDAHFGNVFLERKTAAEGWNYFDYLYFDPAFAGRHSPLLDVIKPLYHNIFATWMYFPQEVARALYGGDGGEGRKEESGEDKPFSLLLEDGVLSLRHNYQLTDVRRGLLSTKHTHLLRPLLEWLREREALPENWREIMQSALMCCPLLTINLLDQERIPLPVCWLGLAHAVEMGNRGIELCMRVRQPRELRPRREPGANE